ncbi:MAG: hypothetical protein LBQ98_07200 [Nitrososphaerota archaeon]|jgi:hypothetical protein|nr:hypothetical protein [Nitrososphaerota archaeon]
MRIVYNVAFITPALTEITSPPYHLWSCSMSILKPVSAIAMTLPPMGVVTP